MTRGRAVLAGVGGGAAAGVLVWLLTRRGASGAASFAFPSFIQFRKVTNATAPSGGFVAVAPRDLARQAGVGLAIYSLARVVGSETGSSADAVEKAAVGWATLNQARSEGYDDITAFVTHTGPGLRDDLYGTQEQPGRRVSTARDPTDADVYVATMILTGQWPDPTNGAIRYMGVASQREMHEEWLRGETNVRYRSPDEVIALWYDRDGLEPVVVPGIDPERQLFFRPA